ncbi:hypothetical protein O3M35_011824 [Rhynocoris fuscipes]|uniref:MAGE domain-containing protein n=1 Tax=Rhynocoris fuscipes TaxID=488301 RepID=A0AAW1CXL1_9HEMI
MNRRNTQSQNIRNTQSQNVRNTQSQNVRSSSSSLRSSQLHLSQDIESSQDDNFQREVNECVAKILAENFTLRPFKRSDILRNVSAKGSKAAKLIAAVKKTLLNVYGLTLEEYDGKFILINPKNKVLDQFKTKKDAATPKEVFLAIILTLIVHNGDELTLDNMKTFFDTLSIDIEGTDSYFGNIKKILSEAENQLYLEKTVQTQPSAQPLITYKWGIRSKHEVSKKDLRPVVAMMYRLSPDQLLAPLKRLYSDDNQE